MRRTTGKFFTAILCMLLTLLPLSAQGQQHISFMGVALGGDMKSTLEQLKQQGLEDATHKSWFPKMYCKYLEGSFWVFSDCDIAIRSIRKKQPVSSVYIHPHDNFLALNDLIRSLDEKYGRHDEYGSDYDVNAVNYQWDVPGGSIFIFGTNVYGQSFDILYEDNIEGRVKSIYYRKKYSEL